MMPSRRHLLLAGVSAGFTLLAGCIADAPANENGRTNECEPIELPRLDTPPHEPTRPDPPTDIDEEDQWDDHFLGRGMDTDSPVGFAAFTVRYREPPVDQLEFDGDRILSAELFTDRDAFEAAITPVGDDAESAVDNIDFETQAVVVVLSGFGSSSVAHEWVRVEDNCDELHVHGYYTWPFIQTDDYTVRTSAVVVDRPEEYDLSRVWVSLTIGEDERANVSTDHGVEALPEAPDVNDDDNTDDLPGPLSDYTVLPVSRAHAGEWWRDIEDGPGIAVTLPDADAVRSIVSEDDAVERFIDETDFADDAVYFLEVAAPNACYTRVEVEDPVVIANDGYLLQASVRIIDESADDVACPQVITFGSVLLRVESEVDLDDASFLMVDGWGNEKSVRPMDIGEFARE